LSQELIKGLGVVGVGDLFGMDGGLNVCLEVLGADDEILLWGLIIANSRLVVVFAMVTLVGKGSTISLPRGVRSKRAAAGGLLGSNEVARHG